MDMDWNQLLLLCTALGAQTLSIRGSAKSMNGKLFEKLVLGSLLRILDFRYCPEPPETIDRSEKLFWLSNMDENERETDATIVYNGKAISVDIGFIGKGNPEITLDKTSRFNRYKQIAGMEHTMSTIIIVDTVSQYSDLINKASRVESIVLQMSSAAWVIEFTQAINRILGLDHPIAHKPTEELDACLRTALEEVDITEFL